MKKGRRISKQGVIIGLLLVVIVGIASYAVYRGYQEQERLRMKEGFRKKGLMMFLTVSYWRVYEAPDYEEKYWEEFLQDEYVIGSMRWINQYMEAVYPDSPYISITPEYMDKNVDEIYILWYREMNDYLETQQNPYGSDSLTFDNVVHHAQKIGCERDIVELLAYEELIEDYDYEITYSEVFFQQPDLPIVINLLNGYMKEKYPEIEFEDITMERLDGDSSETDDIYKELKNTEDILAEQGKDFSAIIEQIHEEADGM